MTELKLRMETKHVDELKPADYNPRIDLKPGDPEFEKIRRSIEEFGFVDPIIWNEQTGHIVGGHQRFKVMKELGNTQFHVSVVNLPLEREKALNVALNKVEGAFEENALAALLEDISFSDIDVTLTGFDTDEIEALIGLDDFDNHEEPEESHYTEKIKAPIYEPKEEEAPPINDLVNTTKTSQLLDEIAAADLPEELGIFLTLAAQRHNVFDYSKIAEYYAHAEPEIQDLMERSALVIIDYDKAVQNGFIEFTKQAMASLAAYEDGDDDDEE